MVQGSNPGGDEIFRTCPDRTWGTPSLLYNGYRVLPSGKEQPGRDADPSPPSIAVVMKEYSNTSTPPMGHTACTEPQCLYKGALYLFFYIFCDIILGRKEYFKLETLLKYHTEQHERQSTLLMHIYSTLIQVYYNLLPVIGEDKHNSC